MNNASDQKINQLDQFVDNLIDQQNFTDLSPEVREELRNDLFLRLDDFIAARVIAAFSDEDVAKFEELLKEGKSQEEIQQFTIDHIPDYQNFLTQAFLEFQDIYLGRKPVPFAAEETSLSEPVTDSKN